jgi:WD40 repeat protein
MRLIISGFVAISICLAYLGEGCRARAQEKIYLADLKAPGAMAFSPDGKLLAVHHRPRGQAITVWNLEARQPKVTVGDVLLHANAKICFTKDGKHIVFRASPNRRLGKPPAINFVDAVSGELVRDVDIRPGGVLADLSEDARFVLTRGSNEEADCRVATDLTTGKHVVMKGQKKDRSKDVISPDGSIVLADEYFSEGPSVKLRVWDAATGKLLRTITRKDWTELDVSPVFAISPDNKIVAVYGLPHLTLRFFSVDTGNEIGKSITDFGKAIFPASPHFAFLRDSKHIVMVSHESPSDIEIWNLAELTKIKTLVGRKEKAGDIRLAISPDGRYVARSNSHSGNALGSISIWDLPKIE